MATPDSAVYRILPDDTPTRRRRVYINAVVDANGHVHLDLPVGVELANTLRTFTLEFDEPVAADDAGHAPTFIHPTAGSIPDFPLDVDEGFIEDGEDADSVTLARITDDQS